MAFTPGQVLTAAQMNALEGATIPTGGVTMYGAGSAPSGWLLCDGTAVSRTTYAALFAVISTTYGVGNGSTTFNLPNLKGKVPVGLDSADTAFDVLGETSGSKTHTLKVRCQTHKVGRIRCRMRDPSYMFNHSLCVSCCQSNKTLLVKRQPRIHLSWMCGSGIF